MGDFEARDVEVAGNRFVRGLSSVAFATSQGGRAHHNTIYLPQRWAWRILQDNSEEPFLPTHDGVVEHNLIVFDENMVSFVNVGGGTAADTFTFHHNAWFNIDGNRTPNLPVEETDGLYNVDPELSDPGTEHMRIGSDDPRYRHIGADAYEPDTQAAQRILPWTVGY